MRLLLLSDAHGDRFSPELAIKAQPTAETVVFLGDGASDFERISALFPSRRIIILRGNNDFDINLPLDVIDEIGGVRMLFTHGHTHYVKYGTGELFTFASQNRVSLVAFGHTHVPEVGSRDGIIFVNPGSIRRGDYAVVDVGSFGIVPILMKLT